MAKILHVEDDIAWRKIVGQVLDRAGHEVVSCATLSEAQQAAKSPFDLIMCDGTLGEDSSDKENGLRWAEELHAQGKNVVVLSSHATTSIPYLCKSSVTKEAILKFLK